MGVLLPSLTGRHYSGLCLARELFVEPVLFPIHCFLIVADRCPAVGLVIIVLFVLIWPQHTASQGAEPKEVYPDQIDFAR